VKLYYNGKELKIINIEIRNENDALVTFYDEEQARTASIADKLEIKYIGSSYETNKNNIELNQSYGEEKLVTSIPFLIDNINWVNDLSFTLQENLIVLECGKTDPHISFSLLQEININEQSDNTNLLKIEYQNSVNGEIQVFFNFIGYNETDSTKMNIEATDAPKTVYFYVPAGKLYGTLKSVRIDPPNGSTFEIYSIDIVEREIKSLQ